MPPADLPDDLQRPLQESAPVIGVGPATADPDPDLAPVAAAEGAPDPALRPAVPREPDVVSHRRPAASRATVWLRTATRPVVWAVRAGGRVTRRGAQAVVAWSRRPSGRLAIPAAMLVTLVGAAVAAGGFVIPAVGMPVATGTPTAGAPGSPTPSWPAGVPGAPAVPTVPPVGIPTGLPGAGATEPPGARADALAGWAEQMSAHTGIPEVALQAYAYAELVVAQTTPGCRLTWTTLAAIGRVESNHGRSGGASLRADGRAVPLIIGAPLDGTGGRKLILDTDGGDLDGDPVYDRAVGPMQFIPQTWRREAVDATGNGVADIHNIHDAALAAANYLCRNQRDLSTADGWWSAVLAYNDVQSYAEAVFAAANEYGQLSRG